MKKLRAGLAYIFYVFVVGAFFVYILFPAETVSRTIVARVAAVRPELRLTIDDVAPILPPGLRLEGVTIAQSGGGVLQAPEIRLYPRWLSLLGRKPSVAYRAVAGGGKIRGTASVFESSNGRQIRMDADLEGVRMEELGIQQPFGNYRVEGAVSGKIRYFQGRQRTADIRVSVIGLSVETPRPFLGVRKLHFENVRTEGSLENRNLTLSRVALAGEQVNGVLTGNLVLGRRWMESRLSLGGTLQLNLQGSEPQVTSEPGRADGGDISLAGRVPVRIRGTLENPMISIR